MKFESIFMSLLNEDLKPYQKNAFRGQRRKKQQWVPDSSKVNPALNNKIEILRNKQSGIESCDMNDLVYVLNNYTFQGDQAPANEKNVWQLANKYLTGKRGKNLGTTGIVVFLDPQTRTYKLKK